MSSPKKLLVVEDDLLQLIVATMRLVKGGQHDIVSAERGDQAVLLARSMEFDLIVMDILLPGMDGIRAIQEIRKFRPDTPIVVITAYPAKYQERAMQAGATEFLAKGVGLPKIVEVVERLLAGGE